MEASLLEMLDDKHRHGGYTKVISDKQDKFLIRERGFGKMSSARKIILKHLKTLLKTMLTKLLH